MNINNSKQFLMDISKLTAVQGLHQGRTNAVGSTFVHGVRAVKSHLHLRFKFACYSRKHMLKSWQYCNLPGQNVRPQGKMSVPRAKCLPLPNLLTDQNSEVIMLGTHIQSWLNIREYFYDCKIMLDHMYVVIIDESSIWPWGGTFWLGVDNCPSPGEGQT